MSQLGESVAIGFILEHSGSCPFCKQPAAQPGATTIIDADPNGDSASAADQKAVDNDSGKLGANMGGKPNWRMLVPPAQYIRYKGPRPKLGRIGKKRVGSNPHHLIPGNDSLAPSKILEWLLKKKGKIREDVGYDVNHENNGVWLPANTEMHEDPRWNDMTFKQNYAIAAMKLTRWQFHDSHRRPYSIKVRKALNMIADKIKAHANSGIDCPYVKKDKNGKLEPPIWLIGHLDGVSARLKTFLSTTAKRQNYFYTSSLVLKYWTYAKTKQMTDADLT